MPSCGTTGASSVRLTMPLPRDLDVPLAGSMQAISVTCSKGSSAPSAGTGLILPRIRPWTRAGWAGCGRSLRARPYLGLAPSATAAHGECQWLTTSAPTMKSWIVQWNK